MELKSLTEQKSLLATLPPGKRARLHRLLFEFGPGNGTLMLLPIDQGIEHGPRDFFPNPASKDPDYQFRLAAEAGYSALACQIGMAEQVLPRLRGPGAADPQGQRQDRHPLLRQGLLDAATPASRTRCGSAPTRSATRSTSARRARTRTSPSCARCARTATASGCRWSSGPTRAAKRSTPRAAPTPSTRSTTRRGWRWRWAPTSSSSTCRRSTPRRTRTPRRPTTRWRSTQEEAIRHCVESAGRSLVVLSGGSKVDDETVLSHTREMMEAGGSGVIFGRNVWQREWSEALEIIGQIKETLLSNVRRIP